MAASDTPSPAAVAKAERLVEDLRSLGYVPRYGMSLVAQSIARLVDAHAQETREACALLAEEHAEDNQRAKDFVATDERSAAIFSQRRDEAECIAAAIRASGMGEGEMRTTGEEYDLARRS